MRLSVVISSYNYADRLGTAITSVLANSRPADEVVVVDDGSTDDSVRVAESFPEVRVLRKDNGGMSSAVNLGITECTGDVVVLLDADDEMLPGRLAWVESAFEDPDVVLAWHPLVIRDDGGSERGLLPHVALPHGDLAAVIATEGLAAFAVTSGIAARRSALEQVGAVPLDRFRNCADAFLVRVLPFVGRVAATDDALGVYFTHSGSDSRLLAAPHRTAMANQLRRRLDMADAERRLVVSTGRAAGLPADERRIMSNDRVYQDMFLAYCRLTARGRRRAIAAMARLAVDPGAGLMARKALYVLLPRRAVIHHQLVRSGDPELSRAARAWSIVYWRVAAVLDRLRSRRR